MDMIEGVLGCACHRSPGVESADTLSRAKACTITIVLWCSTIFGLREDFHMRGGYGAVTAASVAIGLGIYLAYRRVRDGG